jgi:hypothetical protein
VATRKLASKRTTWQQQQQQQWSKRQQQQTLHMVLAQTLLNWPCRLHSTK